MLIATRTLKLQTGAAQTQVPVRIYLPQERNGSWSCQYEIGWPDGRWEHVASGADSVQALLVALQMIGSLIYNSEYHKSGRLMLDGPRGGYGFPVPKAIHDLLIGDDARFF